MIQYSQLPEAVVLGGYVNGLGLVRSMGAIGVKSTVVDVTKSIAGASRWAEERQCPDPCTNESGFIDFLKRLGRQKKKRPVIFATNDVWLFPILRHRSSLESLFRFPMSRLNVIENCLDKKNLSEIAKFYGIPHPASFFCNNTEEIDSQKKAFKYPSILKPVVTVGFAERLGWGGRNTILFSENDTKKIISDLNNSGLSNRAVIIQEHIPGPVENLYTFSSYSNESADVLSWSTGHKIRQHPPKAGTITSGRVVNDHNLTELGKKVIKAFRFHGVANTEFKKDERTGEYVLIEINARPGMWNRSALETGINLPGLAYSESVGVNFDYLPNSPKQVVWVNSLSDAFYGMYKNGKSYQGVDNLSFKEWYKSLRGIKVDAIWNSRDPMPYFAYMLSLIRKVFKR